MRIQETLIVEGRDDYSNVSRCLQADIIITHGYGIRESTFKKIQVAYERHGIIIFTDPDRAGEEIRKRLSRRFPKAKHAFLSRSEAHKDGDIGIENASCQAIRAALSKLHTPGKISHEFGMQDLFQAGMSGSAGAVERRDRMGEILGIGYGNSHQFLKRLNLFGITREEWNGALEVLDAG